SAVRIVPAPPPLPTLFPYTPLFRSRSFRYCRTLPGAAGLGETSSGRIPGHPVGVGEHLFPGAGAARRGLAAAGGFVSRPSGAGDGAVRGAQRCPGGGAALAVGGYRRGHARLARGDAVHDTTGGRAALAVAGDGNRGPVPAGGSAGAAARMVLADQRVERRGI